MISLADRRRRTVERAKAVARVVEHLGELHDTVIRAGMGLIVRLVPWLVLYGEASIDLTTVPAWMSDGGALVSYTSRYGGGLRFEFGH